MLFQVLQPGKFEKLMSAISWNQKFFDIVITKSRLDNLVHFPDYLQDKDIYMVTI